MVDYKKEKQKKLKEKQRELVVIDGTNAILGRVMAFAAKQALYGKRVVVVNCNDIVIHGKPHSVIATYNNKIVRGSTEYGPYFPKTVEKLARRTVRGMLPYKKDRGREAFRRIFCYADVPAEYDSKEKLNFKKSIEFSTHYITLKELCKLL